MEPEGSLPHPQAPATCPYPEPALSSPYTHLPLPEDLPEYCPPPSKPGSPKWSLTHRFPHQNPVYASSLPHPPTCLAHLIPLNFITWTISGEEYRSLSSSFWSFHHYPVTSRHLDPNILLSTLFSNNGSLPSFHNVSDQVSQHLYIKLKSDPTKFQYRHL